MSLGVANNKAASAEVLDLQHLHTICVFSSFMLTRPSRFQMLVYYTWRAFKRLLPILPSVDCVCFRIPDFFVFFLSLYVLLQPKLLIDLAIDDLSSSEVPNEDGIRTHPAARNHLYFRAGSMVYTNVHQTGQVPPLYVQPTECSLLL